MRQVLFSSLFSLFLCLKFRPTGFTPSTDASVAGVIKDVNGAALPGVTVIIRNKATGFQFGTVTITKGKYFRSSIMNAENVETKSDSLPA